jgi:phytoene dehydrogenase-like protein
MARRYDAVVVGAGPNGLAAAVVLTRAGHSVLVLEAEDTIGGGCRSAALTLPGFTHDVCAAIHPLAVVSPLFKEMPLADYGVEWLPSPAAVAHPFDDGTAAVLYRSLEQTGTTIEPDAAAWSRLLKPFVGNANAIVADVLRPLRMPRHPLLMARFGMAGLQSCASLVRSRFQGDRARALFAGCAAHSFLPLDAPVSASFGLVLVLAGHVTHWPCVRGGSQQLVNAMQRYLESLGGRIETGRRIEALNELPEHRVVLMDLAPRAVETVAADALPARYRAQLRAYRHGPGVFKIDWALRSPIPWTAKECTQAAIVHLGASFEEIAASESAANDGPAT